MGGATFSAHLVRISNKIGQLSFVRGHDIVSPSRPFADRIPGEALSYALSLGKVSRRRSDVRRAEGSGSCQCRYVNGGET